MSRVGVCNRCKFFNNDMGHKNENYGNCMLYPPVVTTDPNTKQPRSVRPTVRREDWCCYWEMKDA